MTDIINSNLTTMENINVTRKFTGFLDEFVKGTSYKTARAIGGRVLGVIVTPITALIDTIAHAALAEFKILFCVFAAYPKKLMKKTVSKEYEFSSVCVHLWKVFQNAINIGFLPIISLFDPSRVHVLTHYEDLKNQIKCLHNDHSELLSSADASRNKITMLENQITKKLQKSEEKMRKLEEKNSALEEIIKKNEKELSKKSADQNSEGAEVDIVLSNLTTEEITSSVKPEGNESIGQ